MDIEIYFHGNPNGFICVPADNGQNFFEFYYNSPREVKKEFRIEARQYQGKIYFYYTYLLGVDVIDTNGRPNAFCAITMRLDEFYADAMCIRDMLEMMYKAFIEGKILSVRGNSLVYTTPEFPSDLPQKALALVQACSGALSVSKFAKIATLAPASLVRLNPLDCTADEIARELKRSSKISISPAYPLKREKDHTGQIDRLTMELSRATAETSQAKGLNDQMRGQLATLNHEVEHMRQAQGSTKRLKDENEQLRKACDSIYAQVESLRTPGGRIVRPNPPVPNPTPQPKGSLLFTTTLITILNTVLILTLMFLISCVDNKKKGDPKADKIEYTSPSTPTCQGQTTEPHNTTTDNAQSTSTYQHSTVTDLSDETYYESHKIDQSEDDKLNYWVILQKYQRQYQ